MFSLNQETTVASLPGVTPAYLSSNEAKLFLDPKDGEPEKHFALRVQRTPGPFRLRGAEESGNETKTVEDSEHRG